MKKTWLYAYICFSGERNFSINEISNRLGILPTKTGEISGDIQHEPLHYTNSYWRFESDLLETLDAKRVIRPILDVFQEKVDEINQLKEEFNLKIDIELVINVVNGFTPNLVLYPEFNAFAAAIGASIDIDLYVHS